MGDEHDRLMRLRQQDGRPLLVPPGLESIVSVDGTIEPWKVEEARSLWAGTRQHLAASPADLAAAERFVFLTRILAQQLAQSGDPAVLRALYESALEAVTLPRHRQTMRGYLARHAARDDDLESAQAWLAGCDPLSHDLEMDSTYRVSQAFVATAARDPHGVVNALGSTDGEVPIADAEDALAVVLRATALERLGFVDSARAQLTRFLTTPNGSGRIETAVRDLPAAWQACAQSLPAARHARRRELANPSLTGEASGWVILVAGVVTLGGLTFLLALSDAAAGTYLSFLALPALAFGGGAARLIYNGRLQRVIAETGVSARGRVLAVHPLSSNKAAVPEMRIDVSVMAPGRGPVVAGTTRRMPHHVAASIIGRDVDVIWSPRHPSVVVLEL